MKIKSLLIVLLIEKTFSFQVSAHEGQNHNRAQPPVVSSEKKNAIALSTKRVQENYNKDIQPIFKKSCMDCHSSKTRYPWYYKIPVIKQFIDSDIKEAREHLDFSFGYPFRSHASPEDDLVAIRDSIKNNLMPPFRYRLLHRENILTEIEKETVFEWIEQAQSALKN